MNSAIQPNTVKELPISLANDGMVRTYEAEILWKIRTSRLGEKKGVLIKKKGVRAS